MLLAMAFDIFFRYFLNSPLIWGQELTLYTFVWTSFLGASMSIKTKEAVAVTIFVDKINNKFRNLLILAGLLVSTIFTVIILYLSISWITNPKYFISEICNNTNSNDYYVFLYSFESTFYVNPFY